MNNQTVETVQRELCENELADSQAAEKRNVALLKLGFVLTFLLYLIFNQHLYLGDATGWNEYLKDSASMAGFTFMMAITVLMSLFLAGVKHHLYLHFGVAGQVVYVVVLLIGFALLAEMFSTSASQDVKSRILLLNDEAYQQTLPSSLTPVAIGDSKLTGDIATARRKLAQCKERLKQGKEPHCKGSAATLHSLLESERTLISAQKEVSVEGQKLNHGRQDQLKADSYNPIVVTVAKMLAALLGGEYGAYVKQAIMLLMMLVAITFEVLHHFLSTVHGETKQRINAMALQLAKMNDRQQQYTPQQNAESNEPFGFNQAGGQQATTAQLNRFKYQDNPPASGERMLPNKQPFGFAPAAKAELPGKAKAGGTGRNSPRLGRSEQHYELPLSDLNQTQPATLSKPLAKGLKANPKQVEQTPLVKPLAKGKQGLYQQWVDAVRSGDCKPSVNPTWVWIQKRIAGSETGSKTHDRTRITSMQRGFFSRAMSDGYMLENPNYKNGMKKFIWSTK